MKNNICYVCDKKVNRLTALTFQCGNRICRKCLKQSGHPIEEIIKKQKNFTAEYLSRLIKENETIFLEEKENNKNCRSCGKTLKLDGISVKDNVKVCARCLTSAFSSKELRQRGKSNISHEEVIQRTNHFSDEQKNILDIKKEFTFTKKINNFVAFDDEQKKWAILSSFMGKVEQIYNYNDIVNFELLEDGDSIASGGLGRALAGGVLFGGTGAIVGGVTGKKKTKGICNSLKLKVTINDMNNPVVYINFIETKTKKSGFVYKTASKSAHECLSTFQLICDRNNNSDKNESLSSADEIMKYKELLDIGAITEEEYNLKKEQLLGL